MEIRPIPRDTPMEVDWIRAMFESGWILVGQQLVAGSDIAIPGRDAFERQVCNIWIRSEPLMPVSVVLAALKACVLMDGDRQTMNELCETMFGLSLYEVVKDDADSSVSEAMGNVSMGVRPVGD